MMLAKDTVTGRLIRPEAHAALTKFREGGGQPFHLLELSALRDTYERNCAANGFPRRDLAHVRDYEVGEAAARVYDSAEQRTEPSPVILFVHGGGWVMGSLETHDPLCRELALRTGLPVVAVDYRLAPEHRFPAAHDDVAAVLQWLRGSDQHGLLPTGVVLAGDSAGGQIAASLAVEESHNPESSLLGQVLLYPVTDVAEASPVQGIFTEGLPLVDDTMAWFVDSYVAEGADRGDPRLSPARGDIGLHCCPAFIVSVDLDPLAADGSSYVQNLVRSGVDVRFRHIQGAPHGIFTSGGVYSVAEEVLDEAATFIRGLAPSAEQT